MIYFLPSSTSRLRSGTIGSGEEERVSDMPTHSEGCGAYLAAKGHNCDCDIEVRLRAYASQLEDALAAMTKRAEELVQQIESAKSALGEHPDTEIDLAQRISEIRDEGRAHFHAYTNTLSRAEEAERDVQRLDWLSVPGRTCRIQERDETMSMHFERKAVHYYINGRYTIVDGDTLRTAIDAARGKK